MARAAWALWHDLASGNGASETRRPVEALEAGGRRSLCLVYLRPWEWESSLGQCLPVARAGFRS
jgi:hypothetical protein